MSDDKIQRAMEFLLEQQAKFDARQQIAQQDINRMQVDMHRMQADMYRMQTEIYTIRQDMKQGFDETREAISQLITINERLSYVCESLTKGLANTNKRVKSLENKAKP
jgi:predicted metalloenzyme YecM